MIRYESCSRPVYPEEALRQGREGTVLLRFLIGADGWVKRALVAKSSGDPALDEAARAGLETCRFHPPLADGKPVDAWTAIEYVWQLLTTKTKEARMSELKYEAIGRYIYGAARFGGKKDAVERWLADDLGQACPQEGDDEGVRALWDAFLAKYPTLDALQENHARFMAFLQQGPAN